MDATGGDLRGPGNGSWREGGMGQSTVGQDLMWWWLGKWGQAVGVITLLSTKLKHPQAASLTFLSPPVPPKQLTHTHAEAGGVPSPALGQTRGFCLYFCSTSGTLKGPCFHGPGLTERVAKDLRAMLIEAGKIIQWLVQ